MIRVGRTQSGKSRCCHAKNRSAYLTIRGSIGEILTQKDTKMDPIVEEYKKSVDRTLLRQNLNRTVEERFLNLMELQRFAEELRLSIRKDQAAS